jgi:hypothetical protein
LCRYTKAQGVHFSPVEFKSVEVLKNMPPSWVTPTLTEVPAAGAYTRSLFSST